MARKKGKKKQGMSYIPELLGEDWLANWSARVGYTPPMATKRGQFLRRITIAEFGNVQADPTLFTPVGPSTKTQKKRVTRAGHGRSSW